MDEYYPQSEHIQLISELQALAKISNLKLCVSSRPWTAFTEAFGKLPSQIRLEDLTSADVAQYVRDHLQAAASTADKSSRAVESSDLDALVQLVVGKAQGVFLWVQLVTSALEERLVASNSLKQLLGCVEDFPDELEDYIRHSIYDRIHKTWRSDTAQALKMGLILSRCRHDLPGIAKISYDNSQFRGYLDSFLPFWLLHEGVDTTDFAITMEVKHMTRPELYDLIDITIKHLNACCKDLLCVFASGFHPRYRTENQIRNYRVEFLHRTVHDFLRTDEMNRLLDSNVPTFFNDDRFLFSIAVACVKVIIHENVVDILRHIRPTKMDLCLDFVETIATTLPKGPPESSERRRAYTATMKELDNVGFQYATAMCDKCCWEHATMEIRSAHVHLLLRLIACHFHSYARVVITNWSTKLTSDYLENGISASILLAALGLWTVHPFSLQEIDHAFVGFLLERVDPNQPTWIYTDSSVRQTWRDTAWVCFLRRWLQECEAQRQTGAAVGSNDTYSSQDVWAVAATLISGGADLEQRLYPEEDAPDLTFSGAACTSLTAAEALRICVPPQCQQSLEEVLSTQGSSKRRTLKSRLPLPWLPGSSIDH